MRSDHLTKRVVRHQWTQNSAFAVTEKVRVAPVRLFAENQFIAYWKNPALSAMIGGCLSAAIPIRAIVKHGSAPQVGSNSAEKV
ncbi:hypothetical protein D3C76_1746480 [compost metagenome]